MLCLDNVVLTRTTLGSFCKLHNIDKPEDMDSSTEGFVVSAKEGEGVFRIPVASDYFIAACDYDSYMSDDSFENLIM